jgi:uncharacterized protein (DUF1919 family)
MTSSGEQSFKRKRPIMENKRCTIMSYDCKDKKCKTLLIFLVNCPKGAMFIKSSDALTYIKAVTLSCEF